MFFMCAFSVTILNRDHVIFNNCIEGWFDLNQSLKNHDLNKSPLRFTPLLL